MKKTLALALALVLSLSLAVSAFAAERPEKEDAGIAGSYTLTRSGADAGQFVEKSLLLSTGVTNDYDRTIRGYQPIPADTTWTFTNTAQDKNTYMGLVITPYGKAADGDYYTIRALDDASLRRDGSFAYGSDSYMGEDAGELCNVYPGQSVTVKLADALQCLGRDASGDVLYCLYIWQNHSDSDQHEETRYYYMIDAQKQTPADPTPAENDPVAKFTDVNANGWYVEAIKYVLNNDLFNGTSDTTFAPNEPMTRAMFVTVLARSVGASQEGVNIWYDKNVQWAIDNGYYDGRAPENDITRQEMALMLYRHAGSPAVSGTLDGFSDADTLSDTVKDAMLWAVQNGYIKGIENDILDPYGGATRAAVATIFMRVFDQQNDPA